MTSRWKKKFLYGVFGAILVSQATVGNAKALQVSPGVSHEQTSTTVSGYSQSINTLNIDLSDPYTKVELGQPNPINSTSTVSNMAKRDTTEGHHVVGGVNASLFHTDTGFPSYLVSKGNRLLNLGAVSNQSNDFMYVPAAFGVNQYGLGQIDRFSLQIQLSHHNHTYRLSSFNRNRNDNESILYTSSFSYDRTRTNPFGVEVVVEGVPKSIDTGLQFGEEVKGKVASIRPYGQATSATIPKDGYVISATGSAVDQIRDLKIGDEVSLSVDVDNKWHNSEFMLASGPLLVQNGKVNMTIDDSSPRNTTRSPRSAVAVDATGTRVFFVTVDGRQSGFSKGMTLREFANYLASMGAYSALNLDGGGSTAMVARQHGDEYATLVNQPSDGSERRVNATLQAVSTAPNGDPTYVEAKQSQPGVIGKGASVGFQVTSVMDQYYNRLSFDNSQTKLSVEGNIGHIEGDKFVADQAGTGSVIVDYLGGKDRIPVTVVDTVGKLGVDPSSIYIAPGQTTTINMKGYSTNGQPLIFNQDAVTLTVNGGIGSIKNRQFTAGSQEGKGSITAAFGTKQITIPVEVSTDPYVLHGLNNTNNLSVDNTRAKSSVSPESTLQPKESSASLKFSYDFTNTGGDVSASYLTAKNAIEMPGQPSGIGVWVYGDGANHWLRGKVLDANGKEQTVDFTSYGGLNWYGWKYVSAKLPSTITYPVSFKSIYIAEPEGIRKNKGFIYLDKLQSEYTTNHDEASFTISSSVKKVDPMKKWTVKFNVPMLSSSINNKTIYVEDMNGNRLNSTVKLIGEKTVEITAPSGGYSAGKTYHLVVTRYVRSSTNSMMTNDHYTQFSIQ
ncbi:phosphodiester glycosidase family protein [Falsibacillus albus]|uniref:Phosphodiester glycosidase family protein n=1 Tax=Falsibacillus albus TaxID=2478915 RepID=A0A3L7K2H3_9BACI|nr:phosphodiester glycosidase family protein [Falsibacillus albus]RLQ96815.1 phosphodiester glycosidase family protein [Falsibacillus albus]